MEKPGFSWRAVLCFGFAAALAARLGFLVQFRENYDIRSLRIAAEIVLRGGVVYGDTTRYNYAPTWAYVVGGLDVVSRAAGLPFSVCVLALFLAADLATAWLLYRLALGLGRPPSLAAGAALLFLANPVSVFASGFFAQFDQLAILLLLLAIRFAARPRARPLAAAGALSFSLLVKHVAWFHPHHFAARREARWRGWPVSLFAYAAFGLSFLPFWPARRAIVAQVLQYRGMGEPYGTEFLRFLPGFPTWGTTVIFALVSLAAVALLRRVEPARGSLMLFLTTLLVLPGVSPYYFVWPIALGSLFGGPGYLVYTVVVTGFFVHSPDGLGVELAHLPGWGAVWWSVAFWLLWEIRRWRVEDAANRKGSDPGLVSV
jgi:hypothetical protein